MLLPIVFALALGAPPQADQAPAARASLDVLVVDSRGRRVETLTAADFSVTERGVPLRVNSVRFVRPLPSDAARPDESSVTASTRLFGILLDEYHVSPGPGAERVRQALTRFVRDRLAPGDMVVVLRPLDSLLSIQLTSDRAVALRAIEAFNPRLGDYTPRSAFERDFIAGAPARIDAARAQIAAAMLDALATHLGRFLPLRKTLLMVTESVVPRAAGRRNDGLGLEAVTVAANRAHVAIYPVGLSPDPSPDRAPERAGDQRPSTDRAGSGRGPVVEALRTLAADTSGRTLPSPSGPSVTLGRTRDGVVDNALDSSLDDSLDDALDDVLADASGYYAVTVDVPQEHGDGQFHQVDVSVSRRDVSVRARKGYWSEPDADRSAPPAPAGGSFLSAFSAQVARRSSPLIRPWFGMSLGEGGTTRVSFVWEPAPRVPGDRANAPVPVRIGLTVSTLDGQTVYRGMVNAATAGVPPGGAASSRARFDVPAGRLLVQMAIEDAAMRVVDRDARDLVVGGFPGPVSLGTAEVLRARTVRELNTLSANPDATPVAVRQFSRAERLLIRVPVFSTGDPPVVSAHLVSAFGTVMRQLPVERTPSRPNVYQVEVALASLAAGAYSIDVTASNSDGDARDRLAIRVTP